MQKISGLSGLSTSTRSLTRKASKFHYVFSISLIVIGVAFTTYYINDILNNSSAPTDSAITVGFSDKFDKETIKKINEFKYSGETTIPPSPAGRTNPFVE